MIRTWQHNCEQCTLVAHVLIADYVQCFDLYRCPCTEHEECHWLARYGNGEQDAIRLVERNLLAIDAVPYGHLDQALGLPFRLLRLFCSQYHYIKQLEELHRVPLRIMAPEAFEQSS